LVRILFPLLDDSNIDSKISEHFGHAPFFGIYDEVDNSLFVVRNELKHNDPLKSAIYQIREIFNPDIIFVKSIGGKAIEEANKMDIEIKTGNYDLISEVVDNLDRLDLKVEDCGHEH